MMRDATSLQQGKSTLMLTVKNAKGQLIAAKDVQVALLMSEKEMESIGMKSMSEGLAKTQVKPVAAPGAFEVKTNLPFNGNWQMKVNLKDGQAPASAVFNLRVK